MLRGPSLTHYTWWSPKDLLIPFGNPQSQTTFEQQLKIFPCAAGQTTAQMCTPTLTKAGNKEGGNLWQQPLIRQGAASKGVTQAHQVGGY